MTETLLNSNQLKALFNAGNAPSPQDFGQLIDVADAARSVLGLTDIAPVSDGRTPGPDSGLIYKNGQLQLKLGKGLMFDENGYLTFDPAVEEDIRRDQTRKLKAEMTSGNLIKKDFNQLIARNGREPWPALTLHNGWAVGTTPVSLLSRPNSSLPPLEGISSAICLAVKNEPGKLRYSLDLRKNTTYLFCWADASNKNAVRFPDTAPDKYSFDIERTNSEGYVEKENHQEIVCTKSWQSRSLLFTPEYTSIYKIVFKGWGRNDDHELGALVTLVQCHQIGPVSVSPERL